MCQHIGLLSAGRGHEVIQALLILIGKKIFDLSIEQLKPLIPKQYGASGIEINNGGIAGLLDADQENSLT